MLKVTHYSFFNSFNRIRTLSWFFTSITNGYMSVQQYDWLLGDRWGWRPLLELQTSHIQDLLSLVSLFYKVSSFNNVTGEAKPWLIMFNCMFPIQVCSVLGIISMLINEAVSNQILSRCYCIGNRNLMVLCVERDEALVISRNWECTLIFIPITNFQIHTLLVQTAPNYKDLHF